MSDPKSAMRQALQESRWGLADLAAASGLSRHTLESYMTGRRKADRANAELVIGALRIYAAHIERLARNLEEHSF